MEHRDADFNIMLATDSYKVPSAIAGGGQTGLEGERLDGWMDGN